MSNGIEVVDNHCEFCGTINNSHHSAECVDKGYCSVHAEQHGDCCTSTKHSWDDVTADYIPLYDVLMEALDQAQSGKGAERHANGLPFLEQPIFTEARECGPAFLAGQARKKIREALHCADDERAIKDFLGAIVYTAAMVIERRT